MCVCVNISHNLQETLLYLFGDGYIAVPQIIDLKLQRIQRLDGQVLTALVIFKNVWSLSCFSHHRSWSHTEPESALACFERDSNKHISFACQKVWFSHQTKWSFAI